MEIEKRTCETCGEETDSFVVFRCSNPRCDIPQHVVCIADFVKINGMVAALLAQS